MPQQSSNANTTSKHTNNQIICGVDTSSRKEIIEEIKRTAIESNNEELVFIGSEDEAQLYAPAIIGISASFTNLIYERQLLIRCFMDAHKMTEEEAEEWIAFNIERALPSLGDSAPILMESIENIIW